MQGGYLRELFVAYGENRLTRNRYESVEGKAADGSAPEIHDNGTGVQMIDQHREAFKEEALELLGELETSLLELEEAPEDAELISRVFRAMHTIKGSGAMFGFTRISEFTHEIETVFDHVRSGKVRITKDLVDLTLKARDQILLLLDAADDAADSAEGTGKEIISAYRNLAKVSETSEQHDHAKSGDAAPGKSSSSGSTTYRIRFRPSREIFLTGTNPSNLLFELQQLGSCKAVAHLDEIPAINEIDPEKCYVFWDILLTTDRGMDSIKDVFIFVQEDSQIEISVIEEQGGPGDNPSYKKLGEIMVERGDLSADAMRDILSQQKRFGEILLEQGLVNPSQIQSALVEQEHVREVLQKRQNADTASSVRVPSEKLDKLVDLVGELVTVQAHLSQISATRMDQQMTTIAEEVEHLTNELRDTALNIRMMPIGATFSKFKRLVRDLSAELGKEIEMVTEGAETELDKTVIERLNDPLVHLLRNSIDHGIEQPEIRREKGKPAQGTLLLTAVHSGDSVLVTIQDDGAGLNREAILNKAIEKGLLPAGADPPDKEVFSLIFAPGFSTAKKVTGVSGRGVGMDVVKRAIDSLRGSIDMTSKVGLGTTITIKLPLTLAIIESLLVKIAGEGFVLPLSLVEECVELTREEVARTNGQHLVNIRGAIIPYIPLRERFALRGEPPEIEQIVITNLGGNRIGFVVDAVVGEHQTVIKTLGRAYRNVRGISGATILGDGSVALILDIPQLVQEAELEETRWLATGLPGIRTTE
jgi:two-component system chemotaxis sensor kinase CheA